MSKNQYRPADMIIARRSGVISDPASVSPQIDQDMPQTPPVSVKMTQAEAAIGGLLDPKSDPTSFVLHIDLVVPQPQPRTSFDDEYIMELAADILANGQNDPIVVEPLDGKRFGIVAGECRYRAIKLNNADTIRVTLKRFDENDIQRSLVQIASNEQRRNFTKLELAQAYIQLQGKAGWTDEQLAQRLNKNRVYVQRVKSLLSAPKEVKDAILSGRESFHNWVNHRDEVLKNAVTGQYVAAPVIEPTDKKTSVKKEAVAKEPSFSLPVSVGVALLDILGEHARARNTPFEVPEDPTRKQLTQIVDTYIRSLRGGA